MDPNQSHRQRATRVALFMRDARVTPDFRDALFDMCERVGQTPNEFCLRAAAEKLQRSGAAVTGVFRRGDLSERGLAA